MKPTSSHERNPNDVKTHSQFSQEAKGKERATQLAQRTHSDPVGFQRMGVGTTGLKARMRPPNAYNKLMARPKTPSKCSKPTEPAEA